MARHDFTCPCGFSLTDFDIPVSVGARAGAPYCIQCGEVMDWRPAIGRMDIASGTFTPFTVEDEIRGQRTQIPIDSLHTLRKVERESEQRARNGEGAPMVWRDYAQNRSNTDVHTLSSNLADPHGVRESITAGQTSGRVTTRKGDAVSKAHGTVEAP